MVGISSRSFTTMLSRDPDTQVAQDTTTSWTSQSTWLWVLRTDPWDLCPLRPGKSQPKYKYLVGVYSPNIHSTGDCLFTPLPMRRYKPHKSLISLCTAPLVFSFLPFLFSFALSVAGDHSQPWSHPSNSCIVHFLLSYSLIQVCITCSFTWLYLPAHDNGK